MPILFEHPGWLLLMLLVIPIWILSWSSRGGLSPIRTAIVVLLRTVLVLVLSITLAQPAWEQEGEGVTVAVVLDRSRSIPPPLLEEAVEWLRSASEGPGRTSDDRIAVVQVGLDAVPTAMPDTASIIDLSGEPADLSETNLFRGIELAKGLLPQETANRILLVSDGNETRGSILAAADLARHSRVPIDVLPLEYTHANEVLVDRLLAPARARQGQAVELTVVLQSQGRATGRLFLLRNGQPLGVEGGAGLPLTLSGGTHVERITVDLQGRGPQQFEAVFEADDPSMDSLSRNNRGSAVTFVDGSGSVLIIADDPAEVAALQQAMQSVGIETEVRSPSMMGSGLVPLLSWDAIVLANVPRWSFTGQQVESLRAYVHDTGGGLLMTGGPRSFGAGGWIDSPLADALPVKLDPPANRQILQGALAMIVHSCEMPQGNYWGQKVAESAIEALSSLDLVGIVEFVNGTGTVWALPMQIAGDKVAALTATRQLRYGDMPEFAPAMQMALQGLQAADAGSKHVIIISDGDPQPPTKSLLNAYVESKVTCTTVLVGPHVPTARGTMLTVANVTGGEFYMVEDPSKLPEIFIKEAQMVVRSLIQEGRYQPERTNSLPGPVSGFGKVPLIGGYDLTAAREGLAQTTFTVTTERGTDPLYAWWNFGLGRSIAFTSDISGRWGSEWVEWSSFAAFWEQSLRWAMRPATPSEFILNTREEDGDVVVDLEALESDAGFLNFLQTRASVIQPTGEVDALDLQQIGPGRYQGRFRPDATGSHVVNVHFASPSEDGTVVGGNIQAAVDRSYSDEYRRQTHNAALLRRVAEVTGGRVLSLDDAILPDLFDRTQLDVPRSEQPAWAVLVIIAAGILILDVAVRRLAVDGQWMRSVASDATARRGASTGAATSLAAWRRSRRKQTRDATPGAVESAPPPPSTRQESASTEDVADESSMDMTSRLKAARERSRRRRDEDGGE
ncbi:MAG: hypothetical protein CMJ24_10830 [Phycisphaerae bacterium]|nr:hypothetical protein [Phycisphaerae bacterium]